jgi:hypothetical protein
LKEIKQLLFLGKRQHQEKAILRKNNIGRYVAALQLVGKRQHWQAHSGYQVLIDNAAIIN